MNFSRPERLKLEERLRCLKVSRLWSSGYPATLFKSHHMAVRKNGHLVPPQHKSKLGLLPPLDRSQHSRLKGALRLIETAQIRPWLRHLSATGAVRIAAIR